MNTYTVTFYSEPADDAEDVEIREVKVSSGVDASDLASGDYDAHWVVTTKARDDAGLGDEWDVSHITFADGEVATVPAGL